MSAMQKLTCRNCSESWTRPAQAGRPPVYCENCRKLGGALVARQPQETHEVRNIVPGRHREFDTLLAVCAARVPAMLVGPAGSGKSTAGRQVAESLGLKFTSESCSPMMTKWDLMGFVGPNGNYVAGVLRGAFENGGVILLDEIDASNPAVLVSLNLLASVSIGETVTFPDGMDVARHPDFVLIAGANTYGDGASDRYVGREQLDAATLDRFAVIDWNYDEAMELAATGADFAYWTTYVQQVRKAAEACNVEILVTPRASINGAQLLKSGMSRTKVEAVILWKGTSPDARRTVEGYMRRGY